MSSRCCISDLPSHVILEILSRLPTKSIIRSKSVCSIWFKLLSGPEFANLQLSRSSTSLIINQLDSSLPDDNDVLKLIEPGNQLEHHDLNCEPRVKFCYSLISTEVFLLGSCNGLLLLNSIFNDGLYRCNPILREFITLPKSEGIRKYPNQVAYGFGYSSRAGQYKVIRIYQERVIDQATWTCTYCKSQGQVYTLGTNSWRNVAHIYLEFGCSSAGVLLNDNLHWLIYDPQGVELICSFDLNRESFQPLPPPPGIGNETIGTLGVLRGSLCLCSTTTDFVMELWVMKEYGMKNSWMKEFVICRPDYWLSYVLIYPLTVLKDGEILFLCSNHTLFSAHPEKKAIREYGICQPAFEAREYGICQPAFEAVVHVSSFVSLKHFVAEEVKKF